MQVTSYAVLVAGLMVAGTAVPALGAQMEVHLDPETNVSPFQVVYQRAVIISFPVGSEMSELLYGKEWVLEGRAGLEDAAVQHLRDDINSRLLADRSITSIGGLVAEYDFHLTGRDDNASIDYQVVLTGNITNYIVTQDQIRKLLDLGWRGMSSDESVVVDGVDINIPLNVLRDHEPAIYELVQGTEAGEILSMPLINADYILEQPMANWHFLFDPTGVSVDAARYNLSSELEGLVVSSWTMGESSWREGIQKEKTWHATITGNANPAIPDGTSYDLRAVQSADNAVITVVGFGSLDVLDGVETARVTPEAPAETATGDFPVAIIYGMAGLAAAGGGLFFVFSNRALKNEKQGQQGIDPSRLVGYQTSAASGGYQTNRGEAQLRDDSDYQQTRSYYDRVEPPPAHRAPPPAPRDADEATCSCATSAEMNSECDCQMQGSCPCDAACRCPAGTCREHAGLA